LRVAFGYRSMAVWERTDRTPRAHRPDAQSAPPGRKLTVSEAAAALGISAEAAAEHLGYDYAYFVNDVLSKGRIPGAIKWQNRWMVPKDVEAKEVRRSAGRPAKGEKS